METPRPSQAEQTAAVKARDVWPQERGAQREAARAAGERESGESSVGAGEEGVDGCEIVYWMRREEE
jgi:hypothetical protein